LGGRALSMSEITINGRPIGTPHRPYLIAEMSANHGGDMERGRRIIRLAAAAGADAIKLQAYTADDLTIDSDAPDFRLESGLWAGQTLYQLYERASTPYAWLGPLFDEARKAGITAFATPFSEAAVEHLAGLGAPAFKIASFEAGDLELIRAAASTGRPMIISTGLCAADDMAVALETARSAGARDVALLKCTSAYPAGAEVQNLLTIPDMADRFGVPIGFSDHTLGNAAPVAAVALGASLVEKHFIDAREPETADSAFSCLPDDLAALRRDMDEAWQARGSVQYGITVAEQPSLAYRRSLYVVAPVKKGEIISRRHVRSIRPGHGLAPRHLPEILGRTAARNLSRGEALSWDMVS
jgi:N-acetylneuraminate synthase